MSGSKRNIHYFGLGHHGSVHPGCLVGCSSRGRGASILRMNGMPTNHLLQCDGDNWSVENLAFDMQDYFPRRMLSAITCKGANWRVANCAVIKIGRFGISVMAPELSWAGKIA